MQSQQDTGRLDFHGTFSGELAYVVERTHIALLQVLHSSYSQQLELGLQKLITLHPKPVTARIELLADKDFVIFATELQLTPDFTLIVRDVLIPPSQQSTTPPISMHWRLQINHGN